MRDIGFFLGYPLVYSSEMVLAELVVRPFTAEVIINEGGEAREANAYAALSPTRSNSCDRICHFT